MACHSQQSPNIIEVEETSLEFVPCSSSFSSLAIEDPTPLSSDTPPLTSSYNERIRPLLDAVDKLRHLKVAEEGIQLPTIVVVGDQSAGKSSVLESLAGISLPRGQGICTRVPLIMRLQHHPDAQPALYLEFLGKIVNTDETHVAEAIKVATDEIAEARERNRRERQELVVAARRPIVAARRPIVASASARPRFRLRPPPPPSASASASSPIFRAPSSNGKGISHTPLTLVVKKAGVPDLTMVDLPGITRVPVHGQPEDIYEQISRIIMEYIKPEESIILNVLSATVDFPTCESIRMSQRVDKTGERTLAVVTKVDKAPEGLLEKVTADDVNIGLGYVCVRNRIGDESYEDARVEEATLFQSHPLLSKINKSMVGVPRLAQKLVQIQATMLSKCLPDIVRKINEKLNSDVSELSRMPQKLSSVAEAMTAFMRIIGLSMESLRKILSRGEFDEYPDDKNMHCTVRLAEMLNEYSGELHKSEENKSTGNFLMDEIRILDETKGIWLPNFLPRAAFLIILQRKVKEIANTPVDFVAKVWNYIESVVIRVLMYHCDSYPQLLSSTRRAAQNLIAKMKEKSFDRVMELVEMEKLTDYTCSPEYMTEWSKLMAYQNAFIDVMNNHFMSSQVTIEGFGNLEVGHLRLCSSTREQAFDMKMRITAYWKIVLRRFVDNLALHLLLSINELVNRNMQTEIVKEIMGSHGGHGIERMLEESPPVAMKREKLNKSIRLLKQSKEVVAQIMDRITVNVD